jgi:hypothetical protein
MSEYSYATLTNEMHAFEMNVLNLMGSFSGWFKTHRKCQKLKN